MATAELEHANWDLTNYFPEFNGLEYREFRDGLKTDIANLLDRARHLGPIADEVTAWASFLVDLEDLRTRAWHIGSYLGCKSSDDLRDEAVQQERGSQSVQWAEITKIYVYVQAAFKVVSDDAFAELLACQALEGAEFYLSRLREDAERTMAPELEELAADLGVTGYSAWGRLYDQVAGRLEFDMPQPDGSTKRVPMSVRRSLLEQPDPEVRKNALVNGNTAWQGMEHVVASTLNAIAGTRLTLYKRRGIEHFLDPALFDSAITRKTLDAMLQAIQAQRHVPRRYLALKAELLDQEKLGFQDLSAPLPIGEETPINWSTAVSRVEDAFRGYHDDLADFAKMSFEARWIESEVREGKAPGGFCSGSPLINESRIFMTYNKTAGDVQTLAHELGHAYHSWVMRDMRTMAQDYPMTLAETASTFAETVYTDAVLADPATSKLDQARLLDTRLDGASAFMLNIPMRYQFEKKFYEERAEGEVSVSRLKELLLEAQRDCYGDVLAEDQMDAYFWASKLHFYITGVSFYNFPYSFGYLFSLGVYARAQQEGPAFHQKYVDLLRLTGQDTAENVARRALGVDLEEPQFWLDSIALVAEDLQRFEALLPAIRE